LPEWLKERGIGETRYALVERGRLLAARIEPDDMLAAGLVVEARLKAVAPRPLALLPDGREVLVRERPHGVTEGSPFSLEILRPALPGREPWKRALGRPARELREEVEPLLATDHAFPPRGRDLLEEAGWSELLEQAESGRVSFAGGELLLALTPAMTVIDVDGWLPAAELAVAGAHAAGEAIRRLDLQGSIGVDLPTTPGKAPRQAAADALDGALAGEAYERTAVNGFGFLQLVRPRQRPSLLELAHDAPAFAARALLRRAALAGHGAARLVVAPPLAALFEARPGWLEQLARQRGGAVTLRADAALAMSGGYVEPA
jgi:ribonuclease G